MTTPPTPDDGDVIERLDAGEPPSSPEEASARAPYERLIEDIRDLEDIPPPEGWRTRAADRRAEVRRRVRRRRQARILIGASAVVGLAAAVLVPLCRTQASEPALQVAVSDAPGTPRRGDHVVGDVLHASARVDQARVELRIYLVSPLASRLIVQCPGAATCRRDASSISVDWTLAEPGTYRIVRLSSGSDIPAPADGTIDRDLLEARNAGASSQIETVTVAQ